MKIQIKLPVIAALFITFNLQLATLHAQGALTPPGAPAAGMKTLAQIEPRTPISAAPFTITSGGSYYLTTNVSVSSGNAITIAANNVTLDLNGFTIASTAAAANGYAIFLTLVTNISIYNGHISSGVTNSAGGVFGGGGFGYGIFAGYGSYNLRAKAVSVAGVLYYGIYFYEGFSSVVESCTVNEAGAYGIEADSVSDSTAMNCGGYGIVANTAQNCRCTTLVGSSAALTANTANNCYGYNSGNGDGLDANNTANNSTGISSGSGTGLFATTANNCYGTSSTGYGLYATTANNCFGNSSGSGYGLYATVVATGCYGVSSTGTGLYAFIASVCHGGSTSGTALSTTHNVNSY